MDYEFRILLLEKDLAHYRSLQALVREHLDAHDKSLEHVSRALGNSAERLDRIEGLIERLAQENLNIAEENRGLQRIVRAFIEAKGNGRETE